MTDDTRQEPERDRGRQVEAPREIPVRGLKDVLFRVKDQIAADNLSVVAAGVAFYAMLAVFPALAALVSLYGLAIDPSDLGEQFLAVSGLLPADAADIINSQLQEIVTAADGSLGLGALLGLALTIWSSTKGVKALFMALNIAYDEQEERGFIKLNLMAIGFTLAGILLVIVLLTMIAGIPVVIQAMKLGPAVEWSLSILRWPLVALILIVAVGLLFRFGPSRRDAQMQWLTWGAAGATLLWIAGSMLFSWYVSSFGDYNKTYGALGAVIVLLMWFYISAYIVLLGAELNAELERQTKRDTTVGAARPMGERGAYVADTVGKARKS